MFLWYRELATLLRTILNALFPIFLIFSKRQKFETSFSLSYMIQYPALLCVMMRFITPVLLGENFQRN